jgi:hypothetical protein
MAAPWEKYAAPETPRSQTQETGQPPPPSSQGGPAPAVDEYGRPLPGASLTDSTGAIGRIKQAASEGYDAATPDVTPGRLMSPVNYTLAQVPGVIGGAFRGAQQAVSEIAEPAGKAIPSIQLPLFRIPGTNMQFEGNLGGGPGLGRDVAAFPEAFPLGPRNGLMNPAALPARPPPFKPTPRFVPEYYGEGTPQNPLGSQTLLQQVTGAIQRADQDRGAAPPGVGPAPPLATPPPAFVPPGASAYPPGTPRAVDAGPRRGDVLAYGTPTEGGGAATPPAGTPTPPPNAGPAPTPAFVPPGTSPKTLEEVMTEAKAIAQHHYDIAKAQGESSYTPASVGKMVDAVDKVAPQGPGEMAVGGENQVTRLQRDMQPLRGQTLTLADVQRMDERMSDHITEALRAGRNKEADALRDIQYAWREQADGVTATDVTGGIEGFQALDPARKAWAQYRKLNDVWRMKERADGTQNPTSSYKTAVNNFTTPGSRAARGWDAEELASLKDSADRGVIGGTLHLLGSRLLPHVGGAVGASVGGIPGFLAGEVVTNGMGAGARNLANYLQTQRVNDVAASLRAQVPPNQLGPPLP